MVQINSELKNNDKTSIYLQTSFKIIRGFLKGCGMKNKFPIFIGKSVKLSHKHSITCGKNVKFEAYSEIQGLSKKGLNFGNNVTIGRGTQIRPSSYYGVGQLGYGLTMGDNSSIGPMGYVGCAGRITIGKNVMIGPRVSLFAENHNFKDKATLIKLQGVNNQGITIEDDCWIGSGVVILDGVTIGKGCVIGAGTLITKDIPANSVVFDKRIQTIRER